jgi:hypothetical protein
VRSATDRRVDLAESSGTLWRGHARLTLRGAEGAPPVDAGRVRWRTDGIDLTRRGLRYALEQEPPAPLPAVLTIAAGSVRLAGGLRLPATVLAATSWTAGWGLGGELRAQSEGIEWRGDAGDGTATLTWTGASLRPGDFDGEFALGEIDARLTLGGAAIGAVVANRGGELAVTGSASTRTGDFALQLQPRGQLSPGQSAWLQRHSTARPEGGYAIAFRLPPRP